jgi:hypothetical protein
VMSANGHADNGSAHDHQIFQAWVDPELKWNITWHVEI